MLKKMILLIFGLYILLLAGLYFFQEKLIFRPKKLAKNYSYSFDKKFEEVNLKTDDNSSINALHFKVENPKGIIVYFHGNKGNLERWGTISSQLTTYGYDVFVMDYRGYGKSKGELNEKNLYLDAEQCYTYAKQFFSEEKIIVYGRSLGGTFATYLASKHKPQQLVLEGCFSNLENVAKFHVPFVPTALLKYKFPSDDYIAKVTCPITVFHGTEDTVISFKGGKKLFGSIQTTIKEFVTIEEGGHNNLPEYEIYKKKIKMLLNP